MERKPYDKNENNKSSWQNYGNNDANSFVDILIHATRKYNLHNQNTSGSDFNNNDLDHLLYADCSNKTGREDTEEKSRQNQKLKSEEYTILIAEDEVLNFYILKMMIEEIFESKCNIIHAPNGKDAIEICKNNDNIDLVFMDIKMPLVTGIEATKEIKKIYPHIPIVAQTAYSSLHYKENATNAGCNDFISKPIEKEILEDILEKFLKH